MSDYGYMPKALGGVSLSEPCSRALRAIAAKPQPNAKGALKMPSTFAIKKGAQLGGGIVAKEAHGECEGAGPRGPCECRCHSR